MWENERFDGYYTTLSLHDTVNLHTVIMFIAFGDSHSFESSSCHLDQLVQ